MFYIFKHKQAPLAFELDEEPDEYEKKVNIIFSLDIKLFNRPILA